PQPSPTRGEGGAGELTDMSNVTSLLVGGRPDAVAVMVPDGPVITYGRLRELVEEASRRLASFGIGSGDRVAMVFPSGPEAVVLFLAAANIATACPLNLAYTETEFRYYLEDIGARFLLVPQGNTAAARAAFDGGTLIEADIDGDGRLSLKSQAAKAGAATISQSTADDIALVLHTSGTTSRPKRVPLRHRNLTTSVNNIIASYQLGPDDVSLCVMPLFHVHGLVASALSTLASGGTVVVPRRFTPIGFWP